jgi:hypothetical protein
LSLPFRVAYVIDPRFPGGTAAAVAAELRAIGREGRISVHAIRSAMFSDRQPVSPQIEAALADLGLSLNWDAPEIAADLVILHNPVFLKRDHVLATRIIARHLVVVTHENLLRPGGDEGFDADHCLGVIDRASMVLRKSLAPISAHNRTTVTAWLDAQRRPGWSILAQDWFNICDLAIFEPTDAPKDRRGRHSRPGFEKFPGPEEMDLCFPEHAQSNIILGADTFLKDELPRAHWRMLPFRSMPVDEFLTHLDFMVYFTSSRWCESFGRVLAEGVAAGKVVISDPATAETFHGAVIGTRPADVDAIIREFIQTPALYAAHVRQAQARLLAFSATGFRQMFSQVVQTTAAAAA